MKKYVFIFIFICLCFIHSHVLAGDAFCDVYANREPQDALFIGKIVGKEEGNVLCIEVLRVVCGEIGDLEIKYYDPTAVKNISIGDYLLLSVEKEDEVYKKCYSVCYEVTIEKGDKISNLHALDRERDEEWEVSLQWFCNTGTTIVDATDSGKYYAMIDDRVSETLIYDMNEHRWYKDPLSTEYASPNTQVENGMNPVFRVLLLAVAIGIAGKIFYYMIVC